MATAALAAMHMIRNVLLSLLHLADRGLVEHFRIVIGSDLLRRPNRMSAAERPTMAHASLDGRKTPGPMGAGALDGDPGAAAQKI